MNGSASAEEVVGQARQVPARPISPAQEKQIARLLSPNVAWPTLMLALILPAAFVTLAVLSLNRVVPAWACTLPLGLISYAHYTLVHEAIHGNVIARPKALAWVNTLVGWVGSWGLGIGWHVLQRTHLMHHSHTNTENDPDLAVKGSFGELVVKWLNGILPSLIPIAAARYISRAGYAKLEGVFTQRELLLSSLISIFTLALLIAAIATGHVLDWLLLWFMPQRIGVLVLMTFFQWMPHYPFDRTDRYGATRISLWPGGDILTFQQNLHLVHHLWPSVPFYRYRKLYSAIKPILLHEGSRIEGLRPRG